MNLYAALCLGLIGVVTGCAQLAPVKPEVTNKPEMAPAKAVTAPVASQPPTAPTTPAAPIAARPAPPPAIAAAPVAPPNPLRPFADVIKDASRTPGLFPIWKREDRVWIEIAADQFDKPFLFAAHNRYWRTPAFCPLDAGESHY
jgi:hypothetical protein